MTDAGSLSLSVWEIHGISRRVDQPKHRGTTHLRADSDRSEVVKLSFAGSF